MSFSIRHFLIFCIISLQSLTAIADSNTDAASFNKAYKQYQHFDKADRPDKALPYAKQAYELGLSLFGENDTKTAALAYNYGSVLLETRNTKEAEVILKTTLDLYETAYGKQGLELIDPLMSLGHANAEYGNSRYQKKYYSRALSIAEKHKGGKSILYADLLLEAGRETMHRSQTKDSGRYLVKSHKLYQSNYGTGHPKTGAAAFLIGTYELARKRYGKAKKYFLESLNTFENPDQPSSQAEMATHAFLVEVYEELNEPEKSTEHCLAIGRMTPYDPDQEYRPLYKRQPKYPMSALRTGHEGHAIVEFTVGSNGMVYDAKAIESSGSKSFENAAVEAAKQFRYAPRFVDGEPVPTEGVQNMITFEIAD
ncbi:MAG: TonB family protein [Gammaproteobacteria bacterium]|nr:TonB family protein [Gammaproteobacteria bacterium]